MACSGVVTSLWSFLGPHSTDSCPMLLWQFLSPAPFFVRALSRPSLLSSPWSQMTFISPSSSPIDETALLCVLVSSFYMACLPSMYLLSLNLFFFSFIIFPWLSLPSLHLFSAHLLAVATFSSAVLLQNDLGSPPPPNLFLPWTRAILFPPFSPILSLFSVFHFVYFSSYCILSPLDATDLCP